MYNPLSKLPMGSFFTNFFSKYFNLPKRYLMLILTIVLSISTAAYATLYYQQTTVLNSKISKLANNEVDLQQRIASVSGQLKSLEGRDEYQINKKNEEEIKNIQNTYNKALGSYEKLVDFTSDKKKREELDKLFAKALKQLSDKNYSSASASLNEIEKQIEEANKKVVAEFKIPENVKESNTAPSSGHSKQKVTLDIGEYLVDVVAADMNSTRVIVDTAQDGDCRDNCPVLPLADYVSRNGAVAGINGSYFCPATYPQCAGKTNSFDTLVMNKNKKYINSDNNVYSTVPAVIFQSGSMRFVGQSLEWGRDTGVDGVLANYPLMVSGGNVVFGGSGDPKQGSKGSRSFVGSTGSTGYIGVVHNATVAEAARVVQKMGIQGALNLDSGGSTALFAGGYKVGPGRNIPNAILFVRK
jgi:hypothetical protein